MSLQMPDQHAGAPDTLVVPTPNRKSRRRWGLLAIAVAIMLLAGGVGVAAWLGRAPTVVTTVSLTFDDGRATAFDAGPVLKEHGVRGTFYVNSALLGSSGYYMTWEQIEQLYDAGHEIGGHTARHADLSTLAPDEARREICQDRSNLLAAGFPVTSFAYPFGAGVEDGHDLVRECGYNSGRTTSVVGVEPNPPADPWAAGIGTVSTAVADLRAVVEAAQAAGGGWVPLMFHDVCSGCSPSAISAADLSEFLSWLGDQRGVVVKPVGEVIGGTTRPVPPSAPLSPAVSGANGVRNAGLETLGTDGVPQCFTRQANDSSAVTWAATSQAHSGSSAQQVTVRDGGKASLVIARDLGTCTPTVDSGRSYVISVWYRSTAPVRFLAERRDSRFAYAYLGQSPAFPPAATWTLASWRTPVAPAGTNGLSFGLVLGSAGEMTVDDFGVAVADGDQSTTG